MDDAPDRPQTLEYATPEAPRTPAILRWAAAILGVLAAAIGTFFCSSAYFMLIGTERRETVPGIVCTGLGLALGAIAFRCAGFAANGRSPRR